MDQKKRGIWYWDQCGVTVVEYVVLLVIVAIAVMSASPRFSHAIVTTFKRIAHLLMGLAGGAP